MRIPALTTVALFLCFVSAAAANRPTPVFFIPGGGAAFESRGGGTPLLFGRGEVIAGTVSMRFGSGRAEPEAAGPLPFHVNLIEGRNAADWRLGVAAYARVRYRNVWQGIDLVFHADGGRLEFDFIVAPGVDYRRIQLRFGSAVALAANGELIIPGAGGELRYRRPVVYQGKRVIPGRFVRTGDRTVAFNVGAYDKTQQLIIDPVLSYSSFLGGTGSDSASAIAKGVNGSIYLAATTACATCGANTDILVTQLDATGKSLAYATYIGGSGADSVTDLALDGAGNVYLTGTTVSGDFPFTAGAYRSATGATEAFVVKLNKTGAVAYSTTLGTGTGYGIAVSASGNAYVAGSTAGEFPLTAGAFQSSPQGMSDAFVAQLNASGSALVYSTVIGGSGDDHARGIALDAAGQVTVAGHTSKPAGVPFPLTAGADAGGAATGIDVFVSRLNAAGTALVYSVVLGGSNDDFAYAVALDTQGNAYITGATASGNFPTTPGACKLAASAGFVTKLNAAGTALAYSTYLGPDTGVFFCADQPGGRLCGGGLGIAVDAAGRAFVTGGLAGGGISTDGAPQQSNAGGGDAFVAQLDAAGSSLLFGTLLGGPGGDVGQDIAVDAAGDVYVAGTTASAAWPVRDAYDSTYNGGADAFVTVVSMSPATCTYALPVVFHAVPAAGGSGSFSVSSQAGCSWMATVTAAYDGPFLGVTSAGTGSGPGTVSYSAAANPAAIERTSTIAVARKLFTITQAGAPCTYALSSVSAAYGSSGGSGSFTITAPVGCSWTASSSAAWATVATNGATVSYTVAANSGPSRSATITAGGQTFTITQAALGCTYSLSSNSGSVGSDGGSGSFTVTAPGHCGWTASSSAAWVTVATNGSTVNYSVAANSGPSRSATITAGGQTFTITQAALGCTYSVSANSGSVGSDGGSGSFTITAPGHCGWTASSSAAWVTVATNGATVSYSVAANSGPSRTATITAGGQTFTITQAALACTYSLSSNSASVGSNGGSGSFTVTAPGHCGWTASSSAVWVTVTTSGSTVNYNVAANSGPSRTATITAGGQTFTIAQAALGCTYSLSASNASVGSSGGSGSFTVTAPGHCGWTASSSAAWATVAMNGATVSYSVAGNSGPSRTATITAGGQTFTITQAAGTCAYNLPVKSARIPLAGGTASFTVESTEDCSWEITGTPSWLTLTSGSTGVGTATVRLTAGANHDVPRTAVLTVAGQKFTVAQTGNDSTPPFGSLDIPLDKTSGLVGAIGVSGWALDNGEVTEVTVWREPLKGEPVHPNGLVYIGDAVFVEGARPDVTKTYPAVPFNDRAGWGMQILTNMQPNTTGVQGTGDGTYRLHVIAQDAAGNKKTLGVRTITCTNSTATRPFGTLDTPGHGSTVSGTIPNWGWTLTPPPHAIPEDARTIWVFINGQSVAHPTYNLYRPDVSTLFPGRRNSGGPVGVYYFDTAQLPNGLNSIAWSVTDDAGRVEGIGSRLFMVNNAGAAPQAAAFVTKTAVKRSRRDGVLVRTGFDPSVPLRPVPLSGGTYSATVAAMDRLELHLPLAGPGMHGCVMNASECGSLPVGSVLSPEGVFYWHVDAAFRGSFPLRFWSASEEVHVTITVLPPEEP